MQLELSLIISQILAFLIMLLILKKFAWKPLLKILNERKEKIESEFKAIDAEKQKTQQEADLYRAKLADIEKEAKQKFSEATALGQQMVQAIQAEARAQARSMLIKAQSDIANEIEKAKDELKTQLVHIVINASQKIISQKMDSDQDQKLIGEIVDMLK